ncbi:MAG: histidine phosphatase family protein, partial [Candidatus Diapherotrites archaeon]|nr:histidine phosphatase family protein [Candidatus Diapherotrites archaeon]
MQIAKMLAGEKIDAIYSSKLRRAIDTAKQIAKFHKTKIIKITELKEIDYGMFEKMTFAEIEKKHSKLWEQRRKNKYNFKPLGGESFAEMDKNRIKPFVNEIKKKHKNHTIAIIAHSGTNRLIMGSILGLKIEEKVNIWQPNECIYAVQCTKSKCSTWHECIGKKGKFRSFLKVKDMEFWNKSFK